MHTFKEEVITGSKDGTVALSHISSHSIEKVHSYQGYHSSVVKCVRFRDRNVFASCGNDKEVQIMDIREKEPCMVTLKEKHSYAINSVSWHPIDMNLIMSSGFGRVSSSLYPKDL